MISAIIDSMKTKEELILKLEASREAFSAALEGLPDEAYLETGILEDWTLKDILAHLTMWEAQVITLLFRAYTKPKPNTVHFGKETTDELNARWFAQNRDRDLELVLDDFEGVRNQTIRRLEDFPGKDLFNLQAFDWLEGQALWKWIAEETYEHEEDHRGQITAWRKEKGY